MERDLAAARTGAKRGRHARVWLRYSVLLLGVGLPKAACAQSRELPDSPGALLTLRAATGAQPRDEVAPDAEMQHGSKLPVCGALTGAALTPSTTATAQPTCRQENPVQPVVTVRSGRPLTSEQKGMLAVRDTVDPFNLLTIAGYSAFAIGFNAHSAFGPGLKGWGRLSGYSFVEDAQGEFFGTFLISSVTHEDPRYRRLARGSVKRRILHAVEHTYVTRHDDGSLMPNYAVLLTYPISAELSNLYVPGVQTDGASTARRIGIGLATDPSGTLVAEFLPDVAKRIHIHVIFIQEILNQVVTGGTAPNVQ